MDTVLLRSKTQFLDSLGSAVQLLGQKLKGQYDFFESQSWVKEVIHHELKLNWPKPEKYRSLTHLIEVPCKHYKWQKYSIPSQAARSARRSSKPNILFHHLGYQHLFSTFIPGILHSGNTCKQLKNQSCLTLNCTHNAGAEQKASPSSPGADNAIHVLDTRPKNQQVAPGIKQQTRRNRRWKYPNARALEYSSSEHLYRRGRKQCKVN